MDDYHDEERGIKPIPHDYPISKGNVFVVYNTPIPHLWRAQMLKRADKAKLSVHRYVAESIERVCSPREQIQRSEREGVSLATIRRDLMRQVFPYLAPWDYARVPRTKRSPVVAAYDTAITSRAEASNNRLVEAIATARKRHPGEIRFQLSDAEFKYLRNVAGGRSTSTRTYTVDDVARAIVRGAIKPKLAKESA